MHRGEADVARVFVAVWPPEDVVDRLLAIPRPPLAGLRWLPRENLHVTLRFLGDADADTVTTRLQRAELPAARAVLGPTVAMLGRHVVVAPVAGLDALAAAVGTVTEDLGQPPDDRTFTGHVTLARCRDVESGRTASGSAVEDAFEVREITVVRSETHPDGARYSTVASVPVG